MVFDGLEAIKVTEAKPKNTNASIKTFFIAGRFYDF
jgi:hypothetical protein